MVIKNLTFLYSHFWHLAEAIRDAGWEVWIAAGSTADHQRIEDAGMHYIALSPAAGAWDAVREVKIAWETYRAMKQVNPDVVHFIYLKNVLTGGVLARIAGVPSVVGAITGFGSLFSEDKAGYKILRSLVLFGLCRGFQHPNAIAALENSDDQQLLVARAGVQPERTIIIPGAGLDRNAIIPRPFSGSVPRVFFAARMIEPKGVGLLIEAAKVLAGRGLRFEVWLAGSTDPGNPHSLTEDQLRRAESAGPIRWLGHQTNIGELLQQCSIVCLPTFYREGLPRILVEASAAGKAIVTTDVPGCREIVTNEVNGILIPPRNAEALAGALERLILDTETCQRMGLASRERFESRYSLEGVLSAFDEGYRKLGVDLALSQQAPSLV